MNHTLIMSQISPRHIRTCEDLDGVHGEWVGEYTIGLNDGHIVTVNREFEIHIASERNEAHAVTPPTTNANNRERDACINDAVITPSPQTINQCRVGITNILQS